MAKSIKRFFNGKILIEIIFKPDWLIVSRERWDPEISIIQEFKNQFNAKIALVEPNSPMVSSINQFLEEHSRNRFINDIDVFFTFGDEQNSKNLLTSLGSRVEKSLPAGSLRLENYFNNSSK